MTLRGVFYDADGELDRAFESIQITDVVFHRLLGTTAQGGSLDQTLLGERGNVGAVLAGKATYFADREVERREESDVKDGSIDVLERQGDGIVVRIFMHEGEGVIVLPVKVEQSRGSVGIPVGDLQVAG